MAKRILMHSQGRALGHLRRTRNIALEVLARDPRCSILNLVDSPRTPFFDPVPGLDYLKLPTVGQQNGLRRGGRHWRVHSLNMDIQEVTNLRAEIILEVFKGFNPDAVLVDLLPVGAQGELKPLLDLAVRRPRRPKLYLGLRGIIQHPNRIADEWGQLGAYDYLKHYNAVLVYDSPDIYDTASIYNLSPHAHQVIYTNNVVGPVEDRSGDPPTEEPFILVMGGSGMDVFRVEKTYLEALPLLSQETSLKSIIITGPNMRPDRYEAIMTEAAKHPVEIHRSVSDATRLIQQAAVVVTMGGYNSVCEILQFRKKTLVIPRGLSQEFSEQEIRAQKLAEQRLLKTVSQRKLTPEKLTKALVQLIHDDDIPNPDNLPLMDGAQQVAELLLG
ncbi:MAG: glycosyltransferase family protein [Dehalococcoidia bacterium]